MDNSIQIDTRKKVLTNYFHLTFDVGVEIAIYAAELIPNVDTSKLETEEQHLLHKAICQQAHQKESPLTVNKLPYYILNRQFFIPQATAEEEYDLGQFEFKDEIIQLKIKKTTNIEQNSKEMKQILGRLFKELMRRLKLERIGRKFFDPSKKSDFPKHMLSLIQGYDINLQIQSEKVLLQIDSCIKTIRTDSYLQYLIDVKQQQGNFDEIKGGTVMTIYNKKFYRVNSILTDKTPLSTFETKKGETFTFSEYYFKAYNIVIQNQNQPLIEALVKRRGQDQVVYLIPELCNPTGETDQMRSNFHLQKDLASVKHCSAMSKIKQSQSFKEQLIQDCRRTFEDWNLFLNDQPLALDYKSVNPGSLIMGGKHEIPIIGSNLDRDTQRQMLHAPIDITKCQILYTARGEQNFRNFMQHLELACSEMKFPINAAPRATLVNNDMQRDSWINSINSNADLVILLLPGPKKKGKFYDDIKRYLINECPIPSQVVLDITLKQDRGLRSVVNKIVQQIGVKTQGVPYSITQIPDMFTSNPTMIVGIDIYHQSKLGKQSILASVATVDFHFGRYTSSTQLMDSEHDISTKLSIVMDNHIQAFGQKNKVAPSKVVVYRDGVSKGQIDAVLDLEVAAIKQVLEKYQQKTIKKESIQLSYIVVNKKVNAKFYIAQTDNIESCKSAESGCLVDQDVVDDYKDFYIVSQNAKQGVATPTHYRVIQDDENFEHMNEFKSLTYKLCFLYYNVTGAIKIPAPVKYAHILSNFIGDRYDTRKPHTLIRPHRKYFDWNVLYFI